MKPAKLERVPLREVWKHEASDFTRWLNENIDVLSEAIDCNIENVEREKKTESIFSVDLVGQDNSGSPVIIENQLERSNHDHLGKLITYLAAMQAGTAIWIVADPRPEHIAALNWLNELSSVDFFLLKIEAVRIEGSPPAPLLTVIVGPSEVGKSIGRSKQEMSEQDHTRFKWWAQLVQHPDAKHHQHIKPGKYSWIGTSSGLRGAGFNYAITKKEGSAELYIDRGKETDQENLYIFDQLYINKNQIEESFGKLLSWERMEGKRACRIRAAVQGGYSDPEDKWLEAQNRMTSAMNRLVEALRPHLEVIDVEDMVQTKEE